MIMHAMAMYRQYLLEFLILINLMVSLSFIKVWNMPFNMKITKASCNIVPSCECNERVLYRQYLLGLRKTRRYLHNTTNVNRLVSILNFTSNFAQNHTTAVLNNTDVGAKNIIMGNIILDVSNVKEIHITTSKEKIIVELDKQKNDINVLDRISNVDSIISTILLLGQIINLN